MSWILALKGIGVGLALAIPVGPVGLLVFRRSVTHGTRAGIVVGSGAALADALMCAIMAYGITTVSEFIARHAEVLNRFGGLALIVIGYVVFRRAPPHEVRTAPKSQSWLAAVTASLVITLANPGTIVGVTTVFAGIGVAGMVNTATDATLLVGGAFTGSMLWWCTLSGLASRLRDKASGYWMRRINQGCGIAVMVLGVVALVVHFA
jgi:putative LysE/RhtB family amino acid efflux pump